MSLTELHQERVAILEALATLSGHRAQLVPPAPIGRPDVLRVSYRDRRVFVGEAKESETPHDRAACDRLAAYWRFAQDLLAERTDVVIAIACPNLVEARGWLSQILRLAQVTQHGNTVSLGSTTALAYVVALWPRPAHRADVASCRELSCPSALSRVRSRRGHGGSPFG